jgi:hypothetical protein
VSSPTGIRVVSQGTAGEAVEAAPAVAAHTSTRAVDSSPARMWVPRAAAARTAARPDSVEAATQQRRLRLAMRGAHASSPRPAASAAWPALGPSYDAFFTQALAVDPADRYPDGDALAAALLSAHTAPSALITADNTALRPETGTVAPCHTDESVEVTPAAFTPKDAPKLRVRYLHRCHTGVPPLRPKRWDVPL